MPYQWRRNKYARKVFEAMSEESVFPVLAQSGNPGLVVSLTSFPLRISTLHLVIKSILKQDTLPERICLCLSEQEFPGRDVDLPNELTDLVPYGLEIAFVSYNLRPHNKYYYAFDKYPDKTIVTMDDDYIYGPDTISRLVRIHEKFSQAVCTNRTRRVLVCGDGFATYGKWSIVKSDDIIKDKSLIALGFGGVLYPPGSHDADFLDVTLSQRLAPRADDLWLKALELKKGIDVATGGGRFPQPVVIPRSQKEALNKGNHVAGDGK